MSDSEIRCDYRDCEKSATAHVTGVDGSNYGVFCWRHTEQLTSPGDKIAALGIDDKRDKEGKED